MVRAAAVGGSIQTEPDPAIAGQDLHVEFDGDGPLYVQLDGGKKTQVALDADGNADVALPVGTQFVFLFTAGPNGVGVVVPVYDLGGV